MIFTDDDLKWFKMIQEYKGWYSIKAKQLQALLARLEAAEKFRRATLEAQALIDGYVMTPKQMEADDDWRKAAGK